MAVYKSKASRLIILLFLIALCIMLIFTIREKNLALLAITIFASAIIIYLFFNTVYIIDNGILIIRSGFLFNEEVDISDIKKIESKRKSVLSGPGFSSDRVLISFGNTGCVIISPQDKNKFIEQLKTINPEIVIE